MGQPVNAIANGIVADLKNKGAIAESPFAKVANDAGETFGAMAAKLASTASDYTKSGREYATENPVKVAAIAALAGVATGGLLSWVMRRRS